MLWAIAQLNPEFWCPGWLLVSWSVIRNTRVHIFTFSVQVRWPLCGSWRWVQVVGVERCPSQASCPGQPISRRKALGKEKGTLSSKTDAQNQALPQVHILKNRKIDQECFFTTTVCNGDIFCVESTVLFLLVFEKRRYILAVQFQLWVIVIRM